MVAGNTQACLGPQGAGGSGSSMEGRRQSWSRKEGEARRREWEAGVSQRLRTRVVEKHSQQFPMEKARLLPGLQAGPQSLPGPPARKASRPSSGGGPLRVTLRGPTSRPSCC